MSKQCADCRKFMSPRGDGATCSMCRRLFHRDCQLLPEKGDIPEDWTCVECREKGKRTDNQDNTPVRAAMSKQGPVKESTDIRTGQGAEAEVAALRKDFDVYIAEQREFREEIRASIRSLTARMDGVERRIEAVERRAAELEAAPRASEVERVVGVEQRMEAVERRAAKLEATPQGNEVSELQQTVARLQLELNDRDQDALLSDLDIGHLPEVKGENAVHTVTVLAAQLGITLERRDVVFAERVGVTGRGEKGVDGEAAGRPRRVVVRLARRQLRDEFLQAARVRRNFAFTDESLPGPPRRVFVNERLTRTNSLLFHKVRELCRQQQWRFSWTRRGRVFARQSDGKQAFSIRTEADILRVFGAGSV